MMMDDVDHVTELTWKQRVEEGSRAGNGTGMEMVGHGTTNSNVGSNVSFYIIGLCGSKY